MENSKLLSTTKSSTTESEEEDLQPTFISNDADAVEVAVEDEIDVNDDYEMEEEDYNVKGQQQQSNGEAMDMGVDDMSSFKIEAVHDDAIFTVASAMIQQHQQQGNQPQTTILAIASGGGDDKAFLTLVANDGSSTIFKCAYDHTDSVSCASFNVDHQLAIGSFDGTVQLYNTPVAILAAATTTTATTAIKEITPIRQLDGPSDIEWISWHPKGGTVLLAGSSDGTVWMWFVPNGKCLQVFVGHEGEVTAGSFTIDGKFAVTCGADGTLRMWAPKTGLSRHVFRNHGSYRFAEAPLLCLDIGGGNDRQLAMTGCEDGTAWVVHLSNKKVISCLNHCSEGDLRSVETVGFAPAVVNVNWCATAGVDGKMKIWDLTNNQCRHICVHGEKAAVTRLRWHRTLSLIYTTASDGVLRLWDARSGNLIKEFSGNLDVINDVDVKCGVTEQGEPDVIVTGGEDRSLRGFTIDLKAILE